MREPRRCRIRQLRHIPVSFVYLALGGVGGEFTEDPREINSERAM